MSHVRAERLHWDKLPEGRWLSQEEMRELLDDHGSHPLGPRLVDSAISHLVELEYVVARQDPNAKGATRPPFQYRKNALSSVPYEAQVRRDAEDARRLRAEATAERDAQIRAAVDQRLRDVGLLAKPEPAPASSGGTST